MSIGRLSGGLSAPAADAERSSKHDGAVPSGAGAGAGSASGPDGCGHRPKDGLAFALLLLMLAAVLGLPVRSHAFLELGGFVLLAYAAWRLGSARGPALDGLSMALIFGLVLLPLLQLAPLPYGLWSDLPARRDYAGAIVAAGAVLSEQRALSLVPLDTRAALFTLAPPLGVFLLAVSLSGERLRWLAVLAVVWGAAQTALALWQYLGVGAEVWYSAMVDRTVSGVFDDRQQLGGYLVAVLPLTIVLLAAATVRERRRWLGGAVRAGQGRAAVSAPVLGRPVYYAVALLLLFAGIVATRLPGVLPVTLLVLVLSTLVAADRVEGGGFGWRGTAVALSFSALLGAAFWLVHTRLAVSPLNEAEWDSAGAVTAALSTLAPWGSGAGTFAAVYPRFQTASVGVIGGDYSIWLVESGLAAGLLLALSAIVYLARWWRLLQRRINTSLQAVQCGAGIGLLGLLCYGGFYPVLHAPGNAVTAALLAALFLKRSRRPSPGRPAMTPAATSGAVEAPAGERHRRRRRVRKRRLRPLS